MVEKTDGGGAVMIKQFVKFGLAGAVNSVVNYIVYILCLSLGMHYVSANITGFIIAVFGAYLLQNQFVFTDNKENRVWWKVLLKTYASYAFTGLILTNILSVLWIDILDLTIILEPVYRELKQYFEWTDIHDFIEYVAPFLNMLVTIPINFFINKFWTYRQR